MERDRFSLCLCFCVYLCSLLLMSPSLVSQSVSDFWREGERKGQRERVTEGWREREWESEKEGERERPWSLSVSLCMCVPLCMWVSLSLSVFILSVCQSIFAWLYIYTHKVHAYPHVHIQEYLPFTYTRARARAHTHRWRRSSEHECASTVTGPLCTTTWSVVDGELSKWLVMTSKLDSQCQNRAHVGRLVWRLFWDRNTLYTGTDGGREMEGGGREVKGGREEGRKGVK